MVYNQFHLNIVPTQGVQNALIKRGFRGPFGFFPTCLNLGQLPSPTSQDLNAFREKFGLENKKVVLFVWRMSPEKGIDQILQLVPGIIKREPNTHFLMVGKGPYLEYYRQLTKDSKIEKHVTFTGYLSDFDLFSAISISHLGLIFVGEAQIFDMAILEYWNYGLPLVIRHAMGIDEVVHEKETGLLFSNLTEAKEKILMLLQNDDLHKSMSSNCKSTVEKNYDIRDCIKILESLYENTTYL